MESYISLRNEDIEKKIKRSKSKRPFYNEIWKFHKRRNPHLEY